MHHHDGGPAFPAVIPVEHSDVQGKDYPNFTEAGMSLRDYFAGQALVGFLGAPDRDLSIMDGRRIALSCYALADAMLEARKTKGAQNP